MPAPHHAENDFSAVVAIETATLSAPPEPRGFAYATSSPAATGEPPCNESFNARYRYFARTPFFVAFKLASCQQLVAPRVAAREHLPGDLRLDNKRFEVINFSTAISH